MQIRPDARLAFLRFRDEGDTAALAQVFDLVAQQLLLVASHVAGKQQQPEDLLQETFLTAIQRADRYDGERPLEPWLVGILVNVTRNDRRRRAREVTGSEYEPSPTSRQPSDAAIEAEFVASLNEAIAGLPVPQREVMTLNLVHGMTPTEIAHATSRPVGTVKSWIHRSLEVVRRRLPASMTVAFGALLRGMDSLLHVREAVVAEGARHLAAAGSASASAALGAAATGMASARGVPWLRWVVASGATTVALVVAMAWWPDAAPGTGAPASVDVAAQGVVAKGTAAKEVVEAPSPGRDAAREPAAPQPASEAPTATVHLVGEFAAAPFSWNGYVTVPTDPDAFVAALPVVANERGEHTILGVPYGLYQLQANRGDEVSFVVDRPDVTVAVPMADGVDVSGRVVDARGVGVSGAIVYSTFADSFELRLPVAATDDHGAFRVPGATRGRYLEARLDGVLSSGLRQVPRVGDGEEMELQLGDAAGEFGVEVLDGRGRPVVGASLQLGGALANAFADENDKTRAMRLPWLGRTDGRGVATCRQAPLDRAMQLFVRAAGLAPAVVTVEPGHLGTTVKVELRDGAVCGGVFGGLAATREDGAPDGPRQGGTAAAMARAIELGADVGARAPTWFWPTCVARADGSYELRGVPEGDVLLQAQSSRGEHVERELVVADGAELSWSPTFGERGVVRGVVLDEAGRPFCGGLVCARAVASRPFFAELDERGAFVLEGLTDRRFELLLQLGRDPAAMVLLRHFGARPGDDVVLRLPPARRPTATLRGRLARLQEKQVGLFERDSGEAVYAPVAADGGFSFVAPPGEYHLIAGLRRITLRRDVTLRADDEQDLGVVDADTDCTVRILAPSASAGAPAEVYAYADELGPMFGLCRLREPVGELVLPAGRYRLLLVQEAGYVDQRLVEVAPDRVNEVAFAVVERGATLRMFAVPTVPRVDFKVMWQIEGEGALRRYVSVRGRSQPADRESGLQVVLPPGDYTVSARLPGGAPVRVNVTLPMPAGMALSPLRLP
ncbi:MAG: sigma-70 family RNA polymerase sigma factor [Planctomycetes bacterium]|nr:sigma-70 family RNA polymerase sigma factor [Planctomycetota bacterium]